MGAFPDAHGVEGRRIGHRAMQASAASAALCKVLVDACLGEGDWQDPFLKTQSGQLRQNSQACVASDANGELKP